MIKGVVLENFMSYESAYVPLEPGLNLICGPNGAGKSSILLGISVVLGQAYTERSRRLSDLIRWGKDQARITLEFDNDAPKGKRLFPQYHTETVSVTRVLKKNGTYYYLMQSKPVAKTVLTDSLRTVGLNPDNLLIIMHQLMVGRFASVSPQEKLGMLEEAVGFQSYRTDVLQALHGLKQVIGEEESLLQMIESTKETQEYWRREYEKYLQKKELERRLDGLRRELLWARIQRRLASVQRIEERIESRKRMVGSADTKIRETGETLQKREARFSEVSARLEQLRSTLVQQTRDEGYLLASATLAKEFANSFPSVSQSNSQDNSQSNSQEGEQDNAKLIRKYSLLAADSEKRLAAAKARLASTAEKLAELQKRAVDEQNKLVESKVESEVLQFRRKLLLEQLADSETQLRIAKEELDPMVAEAERLGPRIEQPRGVVEIMVDIAAVEEQLRPIGHLSEDVEKMFRSYSTMFDDIRSKTDQVAKNRQELLGELEKRLYKWREILETYLQELSGIYNSLLQHVGATGTLRLNNRNDIEKAGLEILVGYKGGEPAPLDSFTQSGGERSIAMMAFLLALQRHLTSPFRAIDEFDVHMDPRNRQIISDLIVASSSDLTETQYVAITPGEISLRDQRVNVVVVQNVEGSSKAGVLK